ncbi:TPA: hypothetical protein DEP30_01780 [Candidatus Nomurabacteria bacterium]|nr:MAG: hypothetical protein A2387_02165 [Candidatus Nomurabacteria bacterium RIFOXYB1_FULL_36_10]HAQ02400.1 hypothetical protein [Candidatus Nomurabacteria bacterium]HAS69858.1 hypothetical protein [Candidatus Nomurabacteria bacterium]HBI35144.1 hypothetical protein [Candidatus Nomurabacteria bacterium]HBU66511.1 hypothetical protein [Candidatus Nomurabacteria bacterium]
MMFTMEATTTIIILFQIMVGAIVMDHQLTLKAIIITTIIITTIIMVVMEATILHIRTVDGLGATPTVVDFTVDNTRNSKIKISLI